MNLQHERTLFRFVQKYCHLLVNDLDDSQMAEQAIANINHPAWILGHLVVGGEFAIKLLGERMSIDAEWMKTFGPGSQVVADRTKYPSKNTLLAKFDAMHDRVDTLIANVIPEFLQQEQPGPILKAELPLMGDMICHLITTHPSTHLGQLSMWRRTQGLPGVLTI